MAFMKSLEGRKYISSSLTSSIVEICCPHLIWPVYSMIPITIHPIFPFPPLPCFLSEICNLIEKFKRWWEKANMDRKWEDMPNDISFEKIFTFLLQLTGPLVIFPSRKLLSSNINKKFLCVFSSPILDSSLSLSIEWNKCRLLMHDPQCYICCWSTKSECNNAVDYSSPGAHHVL